MAKVIIILAFIATAYSAVIKNEDVQLRRIARSPCSTCNPPPMPPLLHTQNWSGLARSSDGLQNTVFSGAAAAADQGVQGEAFSLASSSAGAGLDGSASGAGADSSNGGGIKARYGGASGVKGSFASQGGEHKSSGGEFKEFHYSYHSGGNKDFVTQGVPQQSAASSSSSSAAQGGSFGGSQGEISGAFTNRGDVKETQNENQGSFLGNKNEHFEGHGSAQQNNQGHGYGFSSGQSTTYGGNSGDADYSHLQYGSSSNDKQFDRNYGGHGHGSDTGFSLGQQNKEDNSFGGAASQGSFGSESSYSHYGKRGGFGGYGGPQKYDQGFGASEVQASSTGQAGFESGKYKQISGNQGQLQVGSSGLGQELQLQGKRGFASGSLTAGQQGFGASEVQSSSKGQAGFGSGQYQQSSGNQGQLQQQGQQGFASDSRSADRQGYLQGSGQHGYSSRSTSDAQSALGGALGLASQGLQTSSQAGCSTCGKNSYALSNAKSRTGNAIALSIGG